MSGRASHSVRAPIGERIRVCGAHGVTRATLLALRRAGELWDLTKSPVVLGFDICALHKQFYATSGNCIYAPSVTSNRKTRGGGGISGCLLGESGQ